jgi:hypothetical protein
MVLRDLVFLSRRNILLLIDLAFREVENEADR